VAHIALNRLQLRFPKHITRIIPMDIALLAPLASPVSEPYASILQMHIHLLARGLKERGHRVRLIAPAGSTAEVEFFPYVTPELAEDIKDEAAQTFWREHFAYALAISRLTEAPPDVLHIHAAHPLPLGTAALLELPQVVTLHTPPKGAFLTGVRTHRFPRSQIKYAALSATQARRWRPHVRQCSIITPGLDLSHWAFQPEASKDVVFWYGRLHRHCGAPQAIAAAHQAGMRIRLAGRAVRRSYVNQQILPLLSESDAFLGVLSPAQLADELGHAAVLAYTPRGEEASALGAARALACGTPVAALHSPAAAELLTAESGCIAPPGDVASLAAAIEVAKAFAREDCRRRAVAYCDPARMILQHEALYQRAMTDKLPDPSKLPEELAA
jgi:glycosyltransferase involved in cell wall biosynthesis